MNSLCQPPSSANANTPLGQEAVCPPKHVVNGRQLIVLYTYSTGLCSAAGRMLVLSVVESCVVAGSAILRVRRSPLALRLPRLFHGYCWA